MSNSYKAVENPSKMLPSFICHVDILEFFNLTKRLLDLGKANNFFETPKNIIRSI